MKEYQSSYVILSDPFSVVPGFASGEYRPHPSKKPRVEKISQAAGLKDEEDLLFLADDGTVARYVKLDISALFSPEEIAQSAS